MVGSALFLGLLGMLFSFMPLEMVTLLGYESEAVPSFLLEMAGGLYLGFALLNWMARGNPIGGIYSRPVAAGNVIHFLVGSIVLGKSYLFGAGSGVCLVLGLFYLLFAAGFGYLLFGEGKSCA